MISRVGAVLSAVSAHEPTGISTTVLAGQTGLARPTAHRLLAALQREGLVERDPFTHRWVLGPELYLLGRTAASRYDLTTVAQPVVRELSRATGESAFFSGRRGDETICLLREDGSFPLRSHVLYEGIRFPLGVASAGLAILAYLPESEIEAFFARADLSETYGRQHEASQVRERLRLTRERGWALNEGHLVEGSWGMAAAVFDAQQNPRWALSLTGVEQRFSADRQREYGKLLLEAAHQLSRLAS